MQKLTFVFFSLFQNFCLKMSTQEESSFSVEELRTIIKYLTKVGKGPKEIHEELVAVLGEGIISYAAVKKWAALFKRGRTSIEDDPRSGRPTTAVNDQNIRRVEQLIMVDRRITIAELVSEMGLSAGSVETIVHKELKMSKVSARWVPRNLNLQDRHRRVECCRELSGLWEEGADDFLLRLVTGDETWIHHWDPESKLESMHWKHAESPPPKKFKTQPSAGKIMASVFWDSEGILLIDYLEHKKTINGQYYADLMFRLRESIKEKRRGKLTKGILLLHDNAPVHKAKVAQAAIRDCGFEELNHPAYSPDLAPSDYYLFRNLKKHLRGERYDSDFQLTSAVESYFEGKTKEFFLAGLQSLKSKWDKCIVLDGDWIEK